MTIPGSVVAAGVAGAINIGYKWVKENGTEAATSELGRNALKTGGFVVLLAFLSLIKPITTIVNILAYIYIGVIALNSGSDILNAIGGL